VPLILLFSHKYVVSQIKAAISGPLREHEKLEQLDEGDGQVVTRRGPDTQPELRSVFLVKLGLNHHRHSHRRLHLVRVGREIFLRRGSQVCLARALNLVSRRLEHFQVQ